ncbi:MAG: peptidoglycan DD-metalloendopeptidase family protein [Gammaproteobacteria bacterium]|nr:peptidoglycan DD-metalloendopeptidase family protein [Gammaproteobacteria bacterium]
MAFLLTPGTDVYADTNPQQRLEAIQADLGRLESWLQSTRRDREQLQEELRRADLALAALATRARDTQHALDTQTELAGQLETEIVETTQREAEARAAVQAVVRQAWLLSRRGPLQLLLEAESPERVARLLAYHEHLARSRSEAIETYRQSRRELENRRHELDTLLAQLEREKAALDTQTRQLDQARRGQRDVLARIDADIEDREAQRTELLRNQERLQELLERLARQVVEPRGETFVASRGNLPWPVQGRILQGFQASRSGGSRRSGGVLLAAAPGSTVRAIHPGRVVFADWMRGLGLLVILDHGGGYMTLYAQAESLLRNVGDMVEAGEPLATAGQSGGSSDSGVWFEIRHNGQPADPTRWCRPAQRT